MHLAVQKFNADHKKYNADHKKYNPDHKKYNADHKKYHADHKKYNADHLQLPDVFKAEVSDSTGCPGSTFIILV